RIPIPSPLQTPLPVRPEPVRGGSFLLPTAAVGPHGGPVAPTRTLRAMQPARGSFESPSDPTSPAFALIDLMFCVVHPATLVQHLYFDLFSWLRSLLRIMRPTAVRRYALLPSLAPIRSRP